jgi:hypothetical protein
MLPSQCRPRATALPKSAAHVPIAFHRPAYTAWSAGTPVISANQILMSLTTPENTPDFYVQAVLSLYGELPGTSQRPSPLDEAWARHFFQRGIPFGVMEAALLLGAVRRGVRPPQAPPLPPIRSLAYFQPIIEELLRAPVSEAFRASLRRKMQRLRGPTEAAKP